MRLDPIAIVALIVGAIPVGAVGAFFLYVSPLTILCVAAALIALLLLEGLRIVWGRHLRRSLASEAGSRPARLRKPAPPIEVHLRFPAA
jgi:hypothetical protein